MDSSMFRLMSIAILLLCTQPAFIIAQAQLIRTTIHSTHPQVIYAPESCCMKNIFKRCMKRYDPFTMSTYVDPDSKKRTFFQTSSWGNEPNSENMKRRVEIDFHGRALEVYGPPQAQLDNRPGHIQISLNGLVMATIDLEAKYREVNNEPWNPLLMYRWEGGDHDSSYTLVITLLDSATGVWKWHPIRGFGFESVVVTSLEPWRPPRYQLSESEKLEDVIIHDTNFVTTFGPSYAWEKQTSQIASSDGIRTFHGTSNELAYSSWTYRVTPVADFSAQCAALAVYGASPAQLHATFREGFRHGHLQLCQGFSCEYVDAHQAYLNVPDNLWNEPVLLYQTDRMSPSSTKTVSMQLLDPPSPVGHLWTMTLSHAICSQVVPKWPWTHPIPHGRYSEHVVGYGLLDYAPTFWFGLFSPWSWMKLYSFAPAKPSWFSFGNLPSWSTTLYAHDIKIFIPFPSLFPASRYADVRCCIDGRCFYPDVEQWYLKARDSGFEVPLVHVQDLDPFKAHHISMTAVRRGNDASDKIIAVSGIEYQRVVITQEPNPTPVPPRPTEHLPAPVPTAQEPISRDDDVRVMGFALAALAVVVLMSAGWCFALWLLNDQQRRRPEREPLIQSPVIIFAVDFPSETQSDASSDCSTRTPRPVAKLRPNQPTRPARNPTHPDSGPSTAGGFGRGDRGSILASRSTGNDPSASNAYRPISPPNPYPYTQSPTLSSRLGTIDDLSLSPTSTYSDLPPAYTNRSAPPSYSACVTTEHMRSPYSQPLPQRHPSITIPARPPPLQVERMARSSVLLDGPQSNQWYNEQPGPSRQSNVMDWEPTAPRSHQQSQQESFDPSASRGQGSETPGRRGRGRRSGRGRNSRRNGGPSS